MLDLKRLKSQFMVWGIFIFAIIFLCHSLNYFKKNHAVSAFSNSTNIPKTQNKISLETTIGIWVPYMDLNIGTSENTQEKFKEKFDSIVSTSKHRGFNTLIVHVRPFCDSLYPSKIFPWSHILTGTHGQNPNFDPLEYMIETCHKNSLAFHAWINPMRIKPDAIQKNEKIVIDNLKFTPDPQKHFITHAQGICLNPAYAEVRNAIIEGIKEIAGNYNIDAIHFDDYFYPEEKNLTQKDSAYEEYLNSENSAEKLSLNIWRKQNINLLIKETYKTIKNIDPRIEFEISPPGNLAKCEDIGADIYTWTNESGFVDRICPQIYWSIGFKNMPFEETVKSWRKIINSKQQKICAGLALYKVGTDSDEGTWKNQNNILSQEAQIIKDLKYNGFMVYSHSFLSQEQTQSEVEELEKFIKNNIFSNQ